MKKILFINHYASRTGAPIMLLHFLKWLKNEKGLSFDVLSLETGDLLDSFSAVSHKHFFKEKRENLLSKAKRYMTDDKRKSITAKLLYPERALRTIAKNEYSLIYANSVLSVPAGCYIKEHSCHSKLLVHFHELNITIHQFCPDLRMYYEDIDLAIAASNKVKDNLISNWGFKTGLVNVIYEHSKIPNITTKKTNDFIVGASGIVNWRKGPDFFILVAKYVCERLPNESIKFQWVGRISKSNRLIYEEDLKRLNLLDKVEFLGAKENPHDYFSDFDMFLMTSKEDPFPLVCIEVGMMGKPIVCFEGATGTEEVLKTVEDTIVPYLDISKMGEIVLRYFNDKNHLLKNGKVMRQIFQEFTPEKQSGKLYKVLMRLTEDSTN